MTKTNECKSCKRRFKLLGKTGECFGCNQEEWNNAYGSGQGEKKKIHRKGKK